MANFCTNCGTKLREDDNFCTNCGTKVIKDDNYCTHCGTKLRKGDNFCTNCGTKVNRFDIKQENHLKSSKNNIEKEKAKKELKRVVGGKLIYNKTFGNVLLENGLDVFSDGQAIRKQVEKEIDSSQIKSEDVEFRVKQLIQEYKIKKEKEKEEKKKKLEKANKKLRKTRPPKEEMKSEKIEENRINNGGYCSLNCAHCYEEFLDSGGGIVGDFDSEGYVDYYCRLGHSIAFGRFCDDYK